MMEMKYYFSVQFQIYNQWVLNQTYGGIVKAIAEDEIDIFYGILGLSIDRIPYYTPILPLNRFE